MALRLSHIEKTRRSKALAHGWREGEPDKPDKPDKPRIFCFERDRYN
jgi:hypothetical protein